MADTSSPAIRWANTPERALDEAALHLERLGYRVLERPYREADLIAASEGRLIGGAVRGLCALAAPDAGNGPQRRRLWRSAAAWLGERGAQPWRTLRFDVISVYLNPAGELVGLDHTPDAF